MDEMLHNLIGRTRPARAALAMADPTASIPIPPAIGPADGYAEGSIAEAPAPIGVPQPYAGRDAGVTEEEQALLYALRLIGRAEALGPLSPVERAFVEGAKVTFDRLAKACKALLDRKVGDLIEGRADPSQPPTGSVPAGVARAGASKAQAKATRGSS